MRRMNHLSNNPEVVNLGYPSFDIGSIARMEFGGRERLYTYSCTVDAMIYPSKFLDRGIYHALHTFWIGHVYFHSNGAILRVLGEFLAHLGALLSALLVDSCEEYAACTSFGEGEACFLTDAAAGLGRMVLAT